MNFKYAIVGTITIFLLSISSLFLNAQTKSTPAPKRSDMYKSQYLDSFSYAIGILEYANFQKGNLDLKLKDFKLGLEEAANKVTTLTEEKANAIVQKVLAERMKQKAASEKLKNAQYFNQLKYKAGIKEIKPGLYYEVIKDASGEKPTSDTTKVKVNYIGTLTDGKEFDNSFKRGEPATFPLNGVIKGWSEVLKNMPVGATWKIYLDSEWGYGERGAGAMVPPNAALIFQVDLLEIIK